MDRRIIPLIMCGGAGTRLWPASREVHPKQFLPLFGPRSTFQETMRRVRMPTLFERPIVITNAAYRFMVPEQLAEIGLEADVLLEPMRRDSGPAIAAGAASRKRATARRSCWRSPPTTSCATPARFVAACREGLAAAEAGHIVTFGVKPERAGDRIRLYQSGRRHFRRGSRRSRNSSRSRMPATAADYISAGYLWNSGNFMFRAAVLLDEYRNFDAASVAAVTDAVDQGRARSRLFHARCGGFRIGDGNLDRLRGDGKDLARRGGAGRCGWSDVGSWQAVWELSDKDSDGNAARGAAVFEDSRNCNVSTDKALVALEGVDDLVVVATQDAVLVSRQKDANGLKRLVAKLKAVAPEVTEEPHQGAPALGLVSIGRQWRPPPGQAHHRQAGRPAVAAEAPPSFRALDRGPRDGAGYRR